MNVGLLLLLIIFVVPNAYALDESNYDVIQIATEEYPPFTSTKLKHHGLMSHIVSAAFLLENIKVEYSFWPAARAFYLAEQGDVDATLPWAKRAGREQKFYYSEPVLDVGWEHFYYKKNLPLKWSPAKRDYNALQDLTIGAIISYNYGKAFQKAEKDEVFQVLRANNLKQLFEMLLAERIDAVVSKELVAQYTLQTEFSPDQISQLASLPENLGPSTYDYLLLSKKKKSSPFFLEALNRGLKKLHSSGQYNEFIANYKKGEYLIFHGN
ncbi:MAG: ABC transporter substrate-binding protein [Bermanella sp.]